jgi:hypothetical protein
LLAVFAASAFQWWILRPQFQKAFRWVPFNLLISLFILAFHWVSEFTYEGLTEWLMNRHVSFDYYSFWALSFWVILLVWTAINIYAGVLIARSDPRIKLFFSDAKLNISFWNQWGTVLFAGLLAGLLLLNNFGGTLGLGILGIALGFSQWLVLRRHLTSWWWIVINLVFGLLSGWALAFDTNGGYVGVFIDNLFILLWFILNISAGPLLVRSAAKRQTTGAQVKTA